MPTTLTVDQLYEQIKQLDTSHRQALLDRLFEDDQTVDEAWKEEIGHRLDEIDSGKATLIDGESVFKEAREAIQRVREQR